jgi:hypothetical protein
VIDRRRLAYLLAGTAVTAPAAWYVGHGFGLLPIAIYRERNRVERLMNRFKQFRASKPGRGTVGQLSGHVANCRDSDVAIDCIQALIYLLAFCLDSKPEYRGYR